MPTLEEEELLWKRGIDFVIGVDEVGRGSFAGPVTAAAVIFKKADREILNLGINDSKLLKSSQRKSLSKLIKQHCLYYATSTIPVSYINKLGIGKASQTAFRKAISQVVEKILDEKNYSSSDVLNPGSKFFLLADGFHIKFVRGIGIKNQKAIIKGDRKSISIAAASIIAKVHRDKIMKSLSKKFPEYHFGRNKGYGTLRHCEAIKEHGLCDLHRTSFNLQKFL